MRRVPSCTCRPVNTTPETLRFDDLQPYLLLKNGNYLYKVPFRGGWAVLKVYYGSRGFLLNVVKSLENVLLAGQTSYLPKTRRRVEMECLDVWRRHGFRVFDTYPEVVVEAPGCPPGGYLLFEYVDAPKIGGVLKDETRPLEERLALFRRFLPEWCRRHELAVAEREPRLVHENGDGKHVMILPDALLWFDFEMIWRSRAAVRMHVAHEIIQYLWFLTRNTPPDLRGRLIAETVRHYPSRARLEDAYACFFRHPNLLHRWGRALERRLKRNRHRGVTKYAVAQALRDELDRA